MKEKGTDESSSSPKVRGWACERGEGVQGVLTLFCSGAAQVCHDDRVVELGERLAMEEEDREKQEGPGKEVRGNRVKENAPWMTLRWLRDRSQLEPRGVRCHHQVWNSALYVHNVHHVVCLLCILSCFLCVSFQLLFAMML